MLDEINRSAPSGAGAYRTIESTCPEDGKAHEPSNRRVPRWRWVLGGLAAAFLLLLAVPALASAAPPTGLTGMALDGRVELAWQPAAGATSYNV